MAGRGLGFWRCVAVALVKPWIVVLTRPDWQGTENLPRTGGAILAANHLSHFDPFAMAHCVYAAGRWPRFLAKASLFRLPLLGRLMSAVRQIPVHRGTANAAQALDEAVAALRDGHIVIIYPEGTTTRDPDLWPMRGKTGVARLALATGAPVLPAAVWGAQRVYDAHRGRLRLRPMTPISVRIGAPIDLSEVAPAEGNQEATGRGGPAGLQATTDLIMARITEELRVLRAEADPGAQDRHPTPPQSGARDGVTR